MASSRLTRALPKSWMGNMHYVSFGTRANATNPVKHRKPFAQNPVKQRKPLAQNAKKNIISANQLPDARLLGLEEANIGLNATGVATDVMQIGGSWNKKSLTGGAAWIVKDNRLNAISGGCLPTYAGSSLEVEALGCLHGIKWARTRQMRNLIIHTESRDLVNVLQGNVPLDIMLMPTIEEIKYKAVLFDWCCVRKVPRFEIEEASNAAIACRGGLLKPDDFYTF